MKQSVSHTDMLKGSIWMTVSVTFLSFSFFFLQLNLGKINYFSLIFYRFFIPLVITWIYMIAKTKRFFPFECKDIKLHLLRVFCTLMAQYSIAFYMMQHSLLNATVILSISPLIIPILERIFFGHKIGRSTIIGATIAFVGVILVLNPDTDVFSLMSGIAILGAFGQAGSQVLYGLRSQKEGLLDQLFYLFLFASIFSIIPFFLIKADGAAFVNDPMVYGSIVLMAICLMGNQIIRGAAYKLVRPSQVAVFFYFSILVSGVIDVVYFNKIPTAMNLVGAALVILGGLAKIFLRHSFLQKK
ncbi:MAG: DMT family transporter [Chlamydiales bacterium]|nr:DMT family transporter [Chlamydiales bacterium]